MKRLLLVAAAAMLQFGCTPPPPQPGQPVNVDQGKSWSGITRTLYYSVDQGSRFMPLDWFRHLKQPDGTAFLSGNLARYGYLRNYDAPVSDLPVGFTTNGPANDKWVGMNCAACHTREIQVGKTSYRIDGGPAISDFQAFLTDVDAAVAHLLTDPATFQIFATDVLGGHPTGQQIRALQAEVQVWFGPYHLIISKGLPPNTNQWGPARLDAVGMIFDRLAGLDIGLTPDHTIPANVMTSDAPVRYPFLWNASRQDFTQCPGFAANGDDLLALARNTGEVIGVFASFRPSKDPIKYPRMKIDYTTDNSSDTVGLLALEHLITLLGPPAWQWTADPALVKQGEQIFNWPTGQGGCVDCHGEKKGQWRSPFQDTWATPLQDVGTDNREWAMLGVPNDPAWPGWQVDTGVLSGAQIASVTQPLKQTDSAFSTLGLAVTGTILQRVVNVGDQIGKPNAADAGPRSDLLTAGVHAQSARAQELKSAFHKPSTPDELPFKYESRVLHGIWATAPYLHNGSVPTLEDLLKPASDRPKSFMVGPAYDPVKVGLAADQTAFNYTLTTTGCDQRTSGNSNCGHEFGTALTPLQKKALLEYLKTL
jgi:mono/diheme cytochrome c family protein